MEDEEIYFLKLAAWLGRTLGEGSSFLGQMDSDAYGIRLPEAIIEHPNVQGASQAVLSAGNELAASSTELEAVILTGDEAQIIPALYKVGENLATWFQAIDRFVSEYNNQINAYNIPDAGERAIAQNFVAQLARRITDYLIINVIETQQPQLALILKVIGLIEWTQVPAEPGNPLSVAYFKKTLNLHLFKNLISDPANHFVNTIKWGSNDFNPGDIFYTIAGFYHEEDDITVGVIDGDSFLQRGIFRFRRNSSQSPPGLSVEVRTSLEHNITNRIAINNAWGIGVDTDIQFKGGLAAHINPPFSLSVSPVEGEVKGILKLFFNRNLEASPFSIIGGNSLLSLFAEDTSLGLGLTATADAIGGTTEVQPVIYSKIQGLTLRVGSSEGDGFLGSILANADIEGRFDLGLEWRGDKGLVIEASGGIEIVIPLHQDLAFIKFNSVFLALRIKPDAALELEVSTIFSAALGPLTASVERMGIVSQLKLDDGNNSRFGFFDLKLDFKPPNGVGLALDAGVIKGGGYLYFDFDREEYAGALELVFSEVIALKAIGLITTRLPDGSKGFSLLIIITVEFGTGLQLGFGFTLLGVGGLLGLNRSVNIDPLKEGIRTGGINSIMFPENVIENAPRIISDLRRFFPPAANIFLLGPMAKIGWGTPTLISVSLGIILELPTVTITILGIIKVALPDENAEVLRLQVNFIGRFEPQNKLLWFYAELYDSRVLFITLEGGMGLLVKWGDQANFLVSVGGFHPRYSPPPLPFPEPPRIAITLLNESYAKVRVEAYFAVTSNSVQFGARVEIFFGLSEFKIEGHLAFDALFQFDPFFFSFSLSVSLSVKVFGVGLFSVGFSGLLEGPTPWHIKGRGEISLLFFSISVPFEETWGEKRITDLSPIDVLPLLKTELSALTNWQAVLPPGRNILVTLRKLGDTKEDALVLHPVGYLQISQRKVPLDLTLEKYGNQVPKDVSQLSISQTGDWQKLGDVQEQFAIGQYKNLEESKKLSSPDFQYQNSGLKVSAVGGQLRTSQAVKRVVRYETIIIDNNYKRHEVRFFDFIYLQSGYGSLYNTLFTHFVAGSAISNSVLSHAHRKQVQPFEEVIHIQPHQYSIARTQNNQPLNGGVTSFNSKASAEDYRQQMIREDPFLADSLHVLPNSEILV